MTFSINKAEAGAFYTNAAMRGLNTDEALNELARTTWAAEGGRHQPTIKRLARPLLVGLNAQHERRAAFEAAVASDRAAASAASAETIAAIRAALVAKQNKNAKTLARSIGIARSAEDAALLSTTLFNCCLGALRA